MKIILRIVLVLMIGSVPAWATLGQYEASVSVDRQQMRSQERVEALKAYTVHELATSNGGIVREFVSPRGLVFGVSWHGPFMPNLQQLLGSYVNTLHTATPAQKQVRHMRGMIVKTVDFVFVSGGRMRDWRGHAYVPSLLPTNLSPEVVR